MQRSARPWGSYSSRAMPEFRTITPPFDYIKKNMSEVEEDLCKSLGLSDITVPKLQYNPLPLQCIAAEALPNNVKDEIEQLTESSIREVRSKSAGSKRSSSSELEMSTRESIVSVPLQFFTNGMCLRLVGGISCPHSGEMHTQIISISKQNEEDDRSEQVASLLGLCVLEFEGQSLKGASFERVRKLTRTSTDILVKLRVRDCRDPSATNKSKVLTKSSNSSPTLEVKERPRLLTMQRYRKFNRKMSIESLHSLPNTLSGTLLSPARSTSSLQNESGTFISVVGTPINTSEDKTLGSGRKKKISTVSLDSFVTGKSDKVESGRKNNSMVTGKRTGNQEGPLMSTALTNQLYVNMPNGMIQLSLKYVNPQKTLYVSLFKAKWQFLSIGSENTSIFYNTYIFPDKRTQGVKYGKIISPTLTTDVLHSRSVSYILTDEEVRSTSIRIILWEQSSQAFSSKKQTFKGEVFLHLNDSEIVNLQGVANWYTICEPDPNLPAVPKAYQNTGTLMRKMMDSANQTFEVMTLKRKKKGVSPSADVTKADSLMDISVGHETTSTHNISKLLEPLKDKAKKDEAPQFCNVRLRPAVVGTMSTTSNGMSLYDFLTALDPMDPTQKCQSLPLKSPLFSSCENLRQIEEELSDSLNSKRSVLSDGTNSVSQPVRRKRGSLFTFLQSFDHSPSQISNAESHDSILSSGSDLSSSLSSVSADRSRDGGRFQGWSEAGSNKSDHNGASSDVSSVHSSSSHRLKQSTHSMIVSKEPKQDLRDSVGHGSIQSSLAFRQSSPIDQSLSPTERVGLISSESALLNDSSYSCEQVSLIQVPPDFNQESPECSITLTPSVTDRSTPETVKAFSSTSDENRSELSPLKEVCKAPLNSTPKKATLGVQMSKSMGNISDELHFVEDDIDGSFEDLDGIKASCVDSSSPRRMLDNSYSASQDNPYNFSFSASQREALECSTNSSSLDFGSLFQPSIVTKNPLPKIGSYLLTDLLEETGEHHLSSSSPHATRSFHDKPNPLSGGNKLSPQQKHKWISMDSGLSPKNDNGNKKQLAKLQVKHPKSPGPSMVKKLSLAYTNGKPYGSVNLKIEAKCVTSKISVEVLDILFFNQKLMNADFDMRVNLYNRLNEQCQSCVKGHLSLRKNGLTEKKHLPPPFTFSGNPMMFYLQVLFQLTNRVFGKKHFHVWIDVKETISESYEQTLWLPLNKLPS